MLWNQTKMATFVRRVPMSLCILVIFAASNCQAQIVGGNMMKDNANLQGNQPILKQAVNVNPNVGGQPPAAGFAQQGQVHFQPQQQGQPGGAFRGAINAADAAAQNMQGAMKFAPGNWKTLMLSEHPDCAEDVRRICSKSMTKNNFAVLDCLQDAAAEEMEQGGEQVSEQCQHLVWTYRKNLTRDDRFESAQKEVCVKELHQFQECQALEEAQGKRIPCLIEHLDNITGPCRHFLNKIATIVFSDYHYVWHFMEHCQADVDRFKCGRLHKQNQEEKEEEEFPLHQQGQTIECLEEHLDQLSRMCEKQILRVADLQSEDYHLDRQVYYACRMDREKLCNDVKAGEGQVYKCLFSKKEDGGMSHKCKEMLRLRQKMAAEDVKVDATFYSACEQDIVQNQCLTHKDADQEWARSAILLCLENAVKRQRQVSGECRSEMEQLREELMEDFEITPEIVTRCANEIQQYCKDKGHGGKTIHCLLRYVNPKTRTVDQKFSPQCRGALEVLLQEADVDQDYKVDHVLAKACAPVIETACQPGHVSNVMDCLLDKLDDERMTDVCEERLLEIQYFVARDYKLDEELYKMCHKDAVQLCHASEDWHMTEPRADNSPSVFPCLYRHMKSEEGPELSKGCRREVRRSMRQRANSINLEPEMLDACLQDLGLHCSKMEEYGKDMEIECLQDNYEELSEGCRLAVGNFTEDEDEDINLDRILMKACTPMIKKFCQDVLEGENPEASDVMDCLIDHKHNREMDDKCKAGIEHHQITQLEDYHFSHKFKEACKKAVTTHCHGRKKNEMIICLSEMVRADTLTEKEHRVDEACRRQLRVEILHRGEDIRLDPELEKACTEDVKKYCRGKHAGNAEIMECLKDHQPKLSKQCHKVLFKREKVEVMPDMGDFTLFKVCKKMIKKHCSMEMHNGEEDVLDCLKEAKTEEDFDPSCRTYVMKRMLEESKDYRLNPSLMKRCNPDIRKFCSHITVEDSEELEGEIIQCLKKKFAVKMLRAECAQEISGQVKETAKNIHLDPVVMKSCQAEMSRYCGEQIKAYEDNPNALHESGDPIEECLKDKLIEGKIKKTTPCGQAIALLGDESKVDVHTDPQVSAACGMALKFHCGDIPPGEGRKMSCLIALLEDNPKQLRPNCFNVLKKRKALWEYSVNVAPPESLQELGTSVLQSRSKTYLLGVLMTIIGVIFLVGISCGRVTKRVPLSMKNK